MKNLKETVKKIVALFSSPSERSFIVMSCTVAEAIVEKINTGISNTMKNIHHPIFSSTSQNAALTKPSK